MTYIKVEGHDNLVRDKTTTAIINTNESEYQTYLKLKQEKQKSNNKINDIENELNIIKSDIGEIKKMLEIILK
jgi:hypothetical protein